MHSNTLVLEPQPSTRSRRTTNNTQAGINMSLKGDNEYRIISKNIGCIGIDSIISHKQGFLKDWLVTHEEDYKECSSG